VAGLEEPLSLGHVLVDSADVAPSGMALNTETRSCPPAAAVRVNASNLARWRSLSFISLGSAPADKKPGRCNSVDHQVGV